MIILRWPETGKTHKTYQWETNSTYLLISWHKMETGFQECVADWRCRTDHAMTVDQLAVVKDFLFGHKCHTTLLLITSNTKNQTFKGKARTKDWEFAHLMTTKDQGQHQITDNYQYNVNNNSEMHLKTTQTVNHFTNSLTEALCIYCHKKLSCQQLAIIAQRHQMGSVLLAVRSTCLMHKLITFKVIDYNRSNWKPVYLATSV